MNSKTVKVRVPGTSANCGPGFDCMGVACTIYNELELTLLEEEQLSIEVTGAGANNIPTDERNIVWRSIKNLLRIANWGDTYKGAVIKMYNEILGGNSNSILFNILREKNSYCYYINSSVKAYDNILIINSGVDSKNIDKSIKLIKKCMKDISSGKFSDEDMESSRNTIISAIKSNRDNPITVINSYFSKVLVGSDSDEERIEMFNKITKDDIIKVSKKVSLHTILTVEPKGGENEEN